MHPVNSTAASQATAMIVRSGVPDTAYFFGAAERTLTGGWDEWGKLRDVLDRRSSLRADTLHPRGGLVGAFRYDGSFVFHDCPEMRVGSCDELWPGSVSALPGSDAGWEERVNREAYRGMVEKAREHIRAGDIYQVNLTRRFVRDGTGVDARELFRHLWAVSEAPLSAYVEIPGGALCSASPELFLSVEGRRIMTRPIKGTRPRDQDPLRDAQQSFELVSSPKEQAELIMITDLERNDLGQICEFGTVEVDELVKRECYSHVFHLVSTVSGTLRAGVGGVEAVRSCFPGGSITGAPKKRAMEILAELEPEPRGWYTGAIGYFGYDGSAQFNIAIRTLVVEGGVVHFHTGSGITADSDPDLEFDETNHKAAALRQAWAQYAAVQPERVAR
jgi:para-aminobenzoate synthetase component I